jgi:hypothetical protein
MTRSLLAALVLLPCAALAQAPASLPDDAQPDLQVAPGTAAKLLEASATAIKDGYVFPDKAAAIESKLRQFAKSKKYPQTSAIALADALSKDLQEAGHDRHLRIIYSHDAVSKTPEAPSPAEQEAERARDAANNFGFPRAEVLEGNIGYLESRFFAEPAGAGETVVAAMGFLANTKALILDLRHNHGGDPATVALLLSYFFGNEGVHLNDIYWRPDNSTGQFWTQAFVPGHKYPRDLYVLIGGDTFSAGEECAYDLQTQKRATLIGEPTGGGAHPIAPHPIADHFLVLVPSGRAINPITHTDWEGAGVQPDVVTPADGALDLHRNSRRFV